MIIQRIVIMKGAFVEYYRQSMFSFRVELLLLIARFICFGKVNKFSAIDGINRSNSKIVVAQGKNMRRQCDFCGIVLESENLTEPICVMKQPVKKIKNSLIQPMIEML